MGFADSLRERARGRARIAYVESDDVRVDAALRHIAARGIANPVLIFDSTISRPLGGCPSAERVDVASQPLARTNLDEAAKVLRARGWDEGPGSLARSPLALACWMLAQGDVEGVVAGAVYPTADIIRCGLALIGRAPGVTSVSGAFYMVVPRGNGEESVFTFADCAAIAEPTSDQLASIALLSARDRRTIVGDEPVVALLSYSTYGSAEGLSVARIRHALELIRAADPDLIVDGELQVDAAIDGAVSARKAPGSVVSGRANVLIFPSLDAGNIAYKLVQRLARAGAIGPILQGLAKPLNDLSRGSDENDIINVTAVTALQGASRPSLA